MASKFRYFGNVPTLLGCIAAQAVETPSNDANRGGACDGASAKLGTVRKGNRGRDEAVNKEREALSNIQPGSPRAEGGRLDGAAGPTRARQPGVWEERDEPFEFKLELDDVERRASRATPPNTSHTPDPGPHQSNTVTKPPGSPMFINTTPPFLPDEGLLVPHVPPPPRLPSSRLHSAPRHATPLSHATPLAVKPEDWDEVTPRSTSVAVALLSSPQQVVECPPISSQPDPSHTPSTEPTGGRRPMPTPLPAAAEVQLSSGEVLPGDLRATGLNPPEPDQNAKSRYSFSPRFSVDEAPITTRGTHVVHQPSPKSKRSTPLRKWALAVLAAFALPFLGGILVTSLVESNRLHTTTNTNLSQNAFINAAGAPATAAPAALAVDRREAHLGPVPEVRPAPPEPVILPQSLKNVDADDQIATGANPAVPAVNAVERDEQPAVKRVTPRKRPTLDPVAFDSSLTPSTHGDPTSYRVRIPAEQKALEPRDGSHNVPINE